MTRTWALALVIGCTGGDDDSSDTPKDTLTDTVVDTYDTGTTIVVEPPQSLTGTLVDLAGAPLADWDVKFCNSFGCRYETTDAAGAFEYLGVELFPYSFEPVPPSDSGFATPYIPVTIAPKENRVIDVAVPMLGASSPLPSTPAEFELGDGLFVTVGSGDLEPPDPFSPEAEYVAGVKVDPADWPPLDGLTGTVLGIWYTGQFDYHATAGLPMRIDDTLGLADAATARVWVGSYADFAWLDAGQLTAGGGQLTGTARLPVLSTVVVIAE